ncbi:family 20 glycosylhydrolase [Actinokineospora soli]|uniref:beta-N-acetylhexosaminidase n=1 Tax=Actinokineospora soli TaxID=1048753 RepID=A0ABW2TRI9_9PSEU
MLSEHETPPRRGRRPALRRLPADRRARGAAPPAQPTVIPRPVSLTTLSGSSFQLTAGSAIVVRAGQDPAVRGVADYLAAVLRPSTGYALPVVDAPTGTPSIELDATGGSAHGQEGYRLRTEGTGRVLLQAHTAEGLSRGVQTLRQLLPARVEASTVQPGPWTIAPVDVTDAPRFAYRGAMLDVARRFVPVADVKRFIEQAARYKVNVFHWHLTDDQGWRLPSTAFPALNQVGASTQSGWAPGTGGPWFYTEADYRSIVEFAAQRYVTVVPEIDGPGHTAAAMAAIPGLNCDDRARAPTTASTCGSASSA